MSDAPARRPRTRTPRATRKLSRGEKYLRQTRVWYQWLGRKFREYRMAQGARQQDVATALGVSTALVCGWERGQVRIDLWQAFEYATALGLTLDRVVQEAAQAYEDSLAEHREDRRSRYQRRLTLWRGETPNDEEG